MKNLIFLVHSFDASFIGGVLKVTSDLANQMVLEGFNVKILSLGEVYDPAFVLDERVILESIGIKKYSTQFYSGVKKIYWFKEVYNLLSSYISRNSNCIFISSSPPLNIIFSIFKIRFPNVYMIGCDHTSTCYKSENLLDGFKFYLYRRLDAIIALTKDDNDFYIAKGLNSVYIPNFINPCAIDTNENLKKFLIFVGRFSSEKRPLLALKIYHKSKLWQKGVNFKMIGGGYLCGELNEYIVKNNLGEYVEILKNIKNPDIIYKDAYGLIMTSSVEGFGMVLLEAIARNIPVVAFDVKYGPRSIIKNGINGFLVNDGDVEYFCNCLDKLNVNIPSIISDTVSDFYVCNVIEKWLELFFSLKELNRDT